MRKGECKHCRYYNEEYCNLMDELVKPLDNCGLYDGVDLE